MTSPRYLRPIGLYLFVSLIFLITLSIWVFILNLNYSILVFVSCAGGIGGILYAMRGFYQHIADNDFEDKWVWWYLFRPIQGIVAGIFSYFLIVGGLVGSFESNFPRMAIYLSISFIAGYSFSYFADSLKSIYKKSIN